MRKNGIIILVLILFMSFSSVSQVLSLEKVTHETINRDIARRSIGDFALAHYLINNFGFKGGAEEFLLGYSNKYYKEIYQRVWQWFGEGGWNEDEPDGLVRTVLNGGRSNNHFHNPLKEEWEEAGLDAFAVGFRYTGQSSVVWAQNEKQDVGGNWSWLEARRYYYKALTAGSRQERERAFANTFRGLGQLCHLIQDASVPAHVRNDIHIVLNYEKWVESIQKHEDPNVRRKLSEFIANPIAFDPSILNGPYNLWGSVPISKIFDTDKYDGTNPNVTAPILNGGLGLTGITEYTNANFFSEDTIVSSVFPYPKLSNAVLGGKEYIPNPRDPSRVVARAYYEKISDGDTGYRLAVLSLLEDFKDEYTPEYGDAAVHSLDDAVYEDYARRLLPRAVGYSSGLLKYFFRGQLQVTAIPIFYRGTLQFMRLKIKNLTPDETMRNGALTLGYRYTPPGGRSDGSDDIFKTAWAMDGSFFVPCTNLESGKEMTVDFRIYPVLPEKDYVDIKFDLAFQGTLGNEVGAVIGKTFKPGWVIFEEEWDKPLPGNYGWAHTGFNWNSSNLGTGSSTNEITDDFLIKKNIRSASGQLARVNESFLGYGSFPGPFPLSITPDTYIMYKIDEMFMSPLNPIPLTSNDDVIGHQFLLVSFTNMLTLMISQEGQMEGWNPTTAYYTFTPGQIIVDNIYELFERARIPIPQSLQINFLSLAQRWYELGNALSTDSVQRMKVDFIRIVEANVQ